MVDSSIVPYLVRAFERQREASVVNARMSLQKVTAEAAKAGALQSGRTLLNIKSEYTRIVREAGSAMCRQAFDAAGCNTEDIAVVVEKSLLALRDAVSNEFADYLRKGGSWAGVSGLGLGNEFLHETDGIIFGVVDDFKHGILGGVRMTKDPIVSVISSITNSPGAVMQSGIGNTQKILSAGDVASIRNALSDFQMSKEVQNLSVDDKQSIDDVTEVISDELSKQAPNASKLARWGKRLIEIAEKLGIAVAASGISRALLG